MSPKTPAKKRPAQHQIGQNITPVRLRYENDAVAGPPPAPRNIEHLVAQKEPIAFDETQDLVFMVLDVVEEAGGSRFSVWGTTTAGHSVLLRIDDFQPYFYIASPRRPETSFGQSGGWEDHGSTKQQRQDAVISWDEEPDQLTVLRMRLNRTIPPDSAIRSIEPLHRTPLLHYRPDFPNGDTYLKLVMAPGANARRAGTSVLRAMTDGSLRHAGFAWKDTTLYEHEVVPLQRFLADAPLSCGAWVCVSAGVGTPAPANAVEVRTPQKGAAGGACGGGEGGMREGYAPVAAGRRVSTCDIEISAPWRSLICLSPDATQLADPAWTPFGGSPAVAAASAPSETSSRAAAAALRGDIAPLRVMMLDVCMATWDGRERAPVPSQGDPIVAISCTLLADSTATAAPSVEAGEERDGGMSGGDGFEGDEEGGDGAAAAVGLSAAAVAGGPTSAGTAKFSGLAAVKEAGGLAPYRSVVFLLAGHGGNALQRRSGLGELTSGATVVACGSEAELLLTWHRYAMSADPDVVAVFQVAHTLEAIAQRFAALRLGPLRLSRHDAAHASAFSAKRITMYSAAWVRNQSRMSSTSNQETFRADIEGRLVVDALRHILTACNLGSFSLADCVQSLLGETLEVLGAHRLAALAGVSTQQAQQEVAAADVLRVARYSMRRVGAVRALMVRLATITEAIEMGRATGLTLQQVMYNAQMIRTWSLLLRTARRGSLVVPSRGEATPLSAHTFIMHPVETGTTGLHRHPVAVLDFASLYPSIYRAHNLCYTTLLHPEDADAFPSDQVIVTPTGAKFVKPGVRAGVLPSILAALTSARSATRAQLATEQDPARKAVLDSRQKALKVTSNALYGFTGAGASNLQCVPLADSCLAYGAQYCTRARDMLNAAAADGRLGSAGADARVIYGHTDSLFLLLPRAPGIEAAIQTGRLAAQVVTSSCPPPMELKFERVFAPFVLLHINRYAGRAFERESDVARGGSLMVKGLRSMWRQAAPILRTTLHGALVRIIMEGDVAGAVKFVEDEVRRLLSGKVLPHELAMTGGLWRVTGEQVEKAAAGGGEGGNGAGASEQPGSGGSEEAVKGPHASLAVRLSQRDPGRTFVLGERLQYVLTAGQKKQDDAAEDPYEAARSGAPLDYDLYWKNKMQRPLQELFATCLSPGQLQALMSGPHTLVRVDVATGHSGGNGNRSRGIAGPASPSPGKGQQKQLGMLSFFKATAKCIGCRRSMPGTHQAAGDAPGLCSSCKLEAGRWEEAYLAVQHEVAVLEAQHSAAHSNCRQCHSGLVTQRVLCDNGECPLTYSRLATNAGLRAAETKLHRLEIF